LERVQSQGSEAMNRIKTLFAEFGTSDRRWTRLRVVACGRADAPELREGNTPKPLELGPFNQTDAGRLAQRLLDARSLIAEAGWAEAIGKASNGYPLVARVLSDILEQAPPQERPTIVEDIRAGKGGASKIATVFYKRFAQHIDVPGNDMSVKACVCLRRVTVAALAATLDAAFATSDPESTTKPATPPSAQSVFEALRRDPTLWAETDPRYLRWRPDLRRLLLECLREENASLLRRMAEAALAAPQTASESDGRNADLIYYGLLAGHGVERADKIPRGPQALAMLDGADEDFPAGSVEQVFLRLLTRRESPSPADLAKLPSSTALRLILAAEPRFAEFGGRSFDQRVPALRSATQETDDSALRAQNFRLLVKSGAWLKAKSFMLGPWIEGPAAREALFFLGVRTKLPGEMQATFLRALDDTDALLGGEPARAHWLVAASVGGDASFSQRHSHSYFETAKYVWDFGKEGELLLAGTFVARSFAAETSRDVEAIWTSAASLDHLSGERIFGGCVSSHQFRLIAALGEIPEEAHAVARETLGDGILTAENIPHDASRDSRLLSVVGQVLRRLEAPAATEAIRKFCALRDPYWAEPLGYALARLYAALSVSTDDMVNLIKKLADDGVLSTNLAVRCASPSISGDTIVLMQTLDEASALPEFIDALRQRIASPLQRLGWWIMRTLLFARTIGRDERTQALAEFMALMEDYKRWGEKKARLTAGPPSLA